MRSIALVFLWLAASVSRGQTDSLLRVWNDAAQPDSARLKAVRILA